MKNPNIEPGRPLLSHRAVLALLTLGLVVIAGLVLGHLFMHGGGPHPVTSFLDGSTDSNADRSLTLLDLQHALDQEVLARRALADRLEKLESRTEASIRSPADGFASQDDETTSSLSEDPLAADDSQTSLASAASRFDDEALLAAGVDRRDAARLRDQWVSNELARAALLDRSIREGWFLSDRRRAEINQLDQGFRSKLQDAEYDQVLYALGKPNRIRIGEVLDGSTASQSELRRNDILLSYDGRRLFKPVDLLLGSSSGVAGESVPIEILRDGRRQTVYVSRGPLGVLTKHEKGAPIGP